METLNVISGNEVVGRLEDVIPDMWYLEGRFVPASSEAAKDFVRRASALDAKATFTDLGRGMRAAIESTHGSGGRTRVVIISLSGEQLFLRRMAGEEEVGK